MRKGSKDTFTSRRYRELMQNNSFECYRQIDPNPSEDVAISPHHHAFYEIIFVISGDFFYEVEGRPYHLSKGDVILIDELQFHHGQIYRSQGYERYALWIHPQYMQRLAQRFPKLDPQYCFLQLNSDNNNLIHLDDDSFSELKSDLAHLFESFWSKTPSDEVLSESYFAILLTRLNQIVHRQHSDEEIPTISATYQEPTHLFTQQNFNLQSLDAITAHYENLAHGTKGTSPHSAAVTTMPRASQGSLEALSPNYGTAAQQMVKQVLLDAMDDAPPLGTWDHKRGTGPFMSGLKLKPKQDYQPDHGLRDRNSKNSGYEAFRLTPNTLYPKTKLSTTLGLPFDGQSQDSAAEQLRYAFELYTNGSAEPYMGQPLGFKLNEASLNPFDISIASPQLALFSQWHGVNVASGGAVSLYSRHLDVARKATLAGMQNLDESTKRPEIKGDTLAVPPSVPLILSDNSARIEYPGLSNWSFKTYDGVKIHGKAPVRLPLSPAHMPLSLNCIGSSYQITELSLGIENDLGQSDGFIPAPLAPLDASSDEENGELSYGSYPYQGSDLAYLDSATKPHEAVSQEKPPKADGSLTPERFNQLTAEISAQGDGLAVAEDDDMHLNLKLTESLKLSAILKYINQNINQDLSLDGLAQRFSLSKFYLTRRFKELTGLSLHQFIVKKRLTRARYLISVGADPYRAAVDAGFNNYSHFSRTFKAYFGQNPSSIPRAHTIHVKAEVQ